MEKERDVQKRIFEETSTDKKVTEEDFFSVLRSIAPGTNIRTALEGVLKAHKGAIIAVENDSINEILDGGFRLNTKFTPQKLIELCKMDGAIILSKDIKKINYA
ncbi:MAG: diadenylate cyclase, partial [Nanoarchaeota archaeon]